jgi:hypothetical protein
MATSTVPAASPSVDEVTVAVPACVPDFRITVALPPAATGEVVPTSVPVPVKLKLMLASVKFTPSGPALTAGSGSVYLLTLQLSNFPQLPLE